MVHEKQPEQKSGSQNSSQPSYTRHLNPRFPYLAVGILVLAIAGVFSTIWYLSGAPQRYQKSITPTSSFSLQKSESPNYSEKKSWALFPSQKPQGAWETPWGVDVFFIHPTTSNSPKGWNIAVDDMDARLKLESEVLPNYAVPFLSAAPVYAPLYRQATLHANFDQSENASKALNLAYNDIQSAFQAYLTESNQGRAIIVVGVGQGGLHAQRLIKEQFQSEEMKRLFVAAYMIETPVSKEIISNELLGFQACNTDEQINCIAAWNTIYENDSTRAAEIMSRTRSWGENNSVITPSNRDILCFNPSMGGTNMELVGPKLHRGSANATNLALDHAPEIVEGAITSQCVEGFLVVSKPEDRRLQPKNTLEAKSFVPAYNLFYSDVAFDAAKRARIASAWLDKNAPKPAPPLPPIERIEIAPIQKIEKILGTP